MKLSVIAALILSLSAGYAFAQTGPTGGSGKGGKKPHVCHADREKFCKDIKAGEGRIKACLKTHEAELDAKCKAAIDKYEE